jgi:hypothetical protein
VGTLLVEQAGLNGSQHAGIDGRIGFDANGVAIVGGSGGVQRHHAFANAVNHTHLSLNAAKSGGNLLQQAWFDVKFNTPLQLRVGKFKTPFSHAYLTTLGETLFPQLPTSLTTATIMPYVLNAVTPSMSTGFDLGVELHGVVNNKFGYEVGLFNGTGSAVNTANKTISDDWHIPSLLYAGRLTYMPWGVMPSTQGNPNLLNDRKMGATRLALSGKYTAII